MGHDSHIATLQNWNQRAIERQERRAACSVEGCLGTGRGGGGAHREQLDVALESGDGQLVGNGKDGGRHIVRNEQLRERRQRLRKQALPSAAVGCPGRRPCIIQPAQPGSSKGASRNAGQLHRRRAFPLPPE